MKESKEYKRVIYIISIVLVYYLSVLLHEYAHGFMAWIFNLKNSPFDIHYGNFFLFHVDENVDYNQLLASSNGYIAALIAIAGITMSSILFIICLLFLKMKKIKKYPKWFYFFIGLLLLI